MIKQIFTFSPQMKEKELTHFPKRMTSQKEIHINTNIHAHVHTHVHMHAHVEAFSEIQKHTQMPVFISI